MDNNYRKYLNVKNIRRINDSITNFQLSLLKRTPRLYININVIVEKLNNLYELNESFVDNFEPILNAGISVEIIISFEWIDKNGKFNADRLSRSLKKYGYVVIMMDNYSISEYIINSSKDEIVDGDGYRQDNSHISYVGSDVSDIYNFRTLISHNIRCVAQEGTVVQVYLENLPINVFSGKQFFFDMSVLTMEDYNRSYSLLLPNFDKLSKGIKTCSTVDYNVTDFFEEILKHGYCMETGEFMDAHMVWNLKEHNVTSVIEIDDIGDNNGLTAMDIHGEIIKNRISIRSWEHCGVRGEMFRLTAELGRKLRYTDGVITLRLYLQRHPDWSLQAHLNMLHLFTSAHTMDDTIIPQIIIKKSEKLLWEMSIPEYKHIFYVED